MIIKYIKFKTYLPAFHSSLNLICLIQQTNYIYEKSYYMLNFNISHSRIWYKTEYQFSNLVKKKKRNVVNIKSYQFSEFVLFALIFVLKWFLHNRIPALSEHHFILMPIKLRKGLFRRLFFRLFFFFFFDFPFFCLLLPVLINIDNKNNVDFNI